MENQLQEVSYSTYNLGDIPRLIKFELPNDIDCICETLEETETYLDPSLNEGYSTIEIQNQEGSIIYKNGI